jgi:hypothetical protein
MKDEDFNLLLESLNQALQYERGERNDLRVTVLAVSHHDQAEIAKLYADASEGDVELAEAGMSDYAAGLAAEDKRR